MKPYISAHKNHTDVPDPTVFYRHTHEEYELLCFISGDADYVIEGHAYPLAPGDIMLTKRAETHALRIHSIVPYTRYVIYFNAEALLGDFAYSLPLVMDAKPLGKFNRAISTNAAQREAWLSHVRRITNAANPEEKRLYLTVLIAEICRNLGTTTEEKPQADTDHLIEYVNRYLLEIRSLEELCEKFYISKTHLNRKFKAMTGSTVWDYVVSKRLIAAKEMLMAGATPGEVSERCGYEEYSAFYRAYKRRFGVSPKEDRKK